MCLCEESVRSVSHDIHRPTLVLCHLLSNLKIIMMGDLSSVNITKQQNSLPSRSLGCCLNEHEHYKINTFEQVLMGVNYGAF
jgi:hypothetical protein